MAPVVARAGAAAAPAAQQQKTPRRWEDEPDSDAWENADTVNSFPEPNELPAPPTPRVLPEPRDTAAARAAPPAASALPLTVVPATPVSPGTMRGPYPTAPGIGEGAPVIAAAAAPVLVAAPPPAPPAQAPPPPATAVVAARAGAGAATAGRGAANASPVAAGTASSASTAGLGSAMREEVWAIVRAAVEEAMGPLVARQRELEARVERAEREGAARGAAPAGNSGSIPVAFGPSVAPPALVPKHAAPPRFDKDSSGSSGGGTPAARGPMLSLPPQGYGVTVVKSVRPSLDLEGVGPVDIAGFDGGRRKRRVAGAVVVLMLMIIIGAVTMTVLSHS